MAYVIKFIARMGKVIELDPYPVQGTYLREYDPEFRGGRGWAAWTQDVREAMLFDSYREAFETWRKQSVTKPLREDGKPNRPLTAYTVSIEKAVGHNDRV